MRILQLIISASVLFSIAGCASMKPSAFEKGSPKLEPVKFFVGHTRSYGVVENPGGKPTARITTETEVCLKMAYLT